MRPDASEQGCNSWNVKNAILDSGKQQSLGSMQQMTKKCNMGLEKCWKMEKVQFYIQAQKTLGCTAQSHKNLAMHLKWGQRLWRNVKRDAKYQEKNTVLGPVHKWHHQFWGVSWPPLPLFIICRFLATTPPGACNSRQYCLREKQRMLVSWP